MLIFGLKMAEMRRFCHANLAKMGDPRTALKPVFREAVKQVLKPVLAKSRKTGLKQVFD